MSQAELDGVSLLEVGDLIPAAFCGKLLADLGAQVIKVERPGKGDASRGFGPFPKDKPHLEKSGLFLYLNTNKKGTTLDLDTVEGQRLFKELTRTVDVLVEDTPPGFMEKRGLDYPRLSAANDQLIMASISGFGRTGPYKDYLAYDLQMWHGSGAGHRFLGDPQREPLRGAWYMASHWGGVNAACGALLALFGRDVIGRGQFVDVAAAECIAALSVGSAELTPYREFGEWKKRTGNMLMQGVPAGMFEAKDGYINIMALTPQQWDALVLVLGSPEWAMNPAYRGNYVDRVPHAEAIYAGLKAWFKEHTMQEVFLSCVRHGVPAAPVNTTKDLLESEHLQARGFFEECEHPAAGRLRMPGALLRDGEGRPAAPAPLLGQHTEEVLRERLGLSAAKVAALKRQGVV